jgi:UPF0755 protein
MLRRLIISLTLIITLAVCSAAGVFYWGKQQYLAPATFNEDQVFTVMPGNSVAKIAKGLAAQGLIASDQIFITGVRLEKLARALKAGEYLIPAHTSMSDLAHILVSGKVILHKITFAEGFSSYEIATLVNSDDRLTGRASTELAEGSLLPETYHFARGLPREKLITRMQKAQADLLAEIWGGRDQDLPIQSIKDAIILASIVEKETGVASERERVAGVFINRLRINMPMQTDPTIIYGITKGRRPLGRPLSRKDLKTENPYNSYLNRGLVPGPISNPGAASLRAVMHPVASKDLYFVANGKGGHAFAKNLKDHNNNVAKWRKHQRAQKKAAQ